MSEQRLVAAAGVALQVAIDGPEGAPWVTMLHSLATNLTLFDPQVAALAAGHRVLRIDARGHGRSAVPPAPYDFARLVADVVAVWDALGVARSHVIGLSMGGMTGFGLTLGHPARVDRLVAADCRADAPPFFRTMWDERRGAVQAGGMAGVVEATLATWLTEATRATRPELALQVRQMILTTPVEGYMGATAALKGLDYERHLASITRPTLLVVGEHDGPHPDEMRAMAGLIPGARFALVEGAAHLANLEQPATFDRLVGDFLGAPG